MGAASVISAGIGMIGANQAKKRAQGELNNAKRERDRLNSELQALEDSRQPIVNPYENVTDTSGNISNTYANLGVATQAAEFQAEQAEISLANTLDTLRATGASAGGATALAQAALASKKQISASLEMQEAKNQQLYAKGEQAYQQLKMQEAQRLQSAEVMGKQFVFGAQETRENQKLNRVSRQLDNAEGDLRAARSAVGAAEGNMYSSAQNLVGSIGSVIASGNNN